MAIDWTGLLNAGLNAYGAYNTANKNQSAARGYGQTTQYNPYNVVTPNAAVGFNGNSVAATLNPTYQGLQSQLTGGAKGLFGGLDFGSGGINPFLQGSFDSYNSSMPDVSSVGTGTDPSSQYFNAANGFLGGLGSFDSNKLSQDYTNNLRAQAMPGQQQAAQGLAQNLFNTGRLGSTGGANIFGQLVQAQNQQDLGFQQAGRDYAGQEQNRLAGLAQSFGQTGNQFQNDYFNRNLASNQNTFNQGNMRAQQRFQNAMGLFGAGQQNLQTQLGAGLGMLQGAQGLDQNLLQQIALGGTLGAQKSSANQSAFAPGLDATVAKNNTYGAILSNFLGQSGLTDAAGGWLGGLFGGGGGGSSNGLTPGTPGMPDTGGMTNDQLRAWMGTSDPNFGTFSSAGGEAAGYLGDYGGDFSNYGNAAGGGVSGGMFSGGSLGDGFGGNDAGAILGGIQSLTTKEGKFAGAASGASSGMSLGGWPGAIIGGVLGYAQEGGYKDAAPWDAAGFSGTTMDKAWQDQNLARLASNPLASLASKAGVKSDSVLGKILDPSALFSKHGDEKRNMTAFLNDVGATDAGNGKYALPDGHLVTKDQLQMLAGSYYGAMYHPDGKQEYWQQKFGEDLMKVYNG